MPDILFLPIDAPGDDAAAVPDVAFVGAHAPGRVHAAGRGHADLLAGDIADGEARPGVFGGAFGGAFGGGTFPGTADDPRAALDAAAAVRASHDGRAAALSGAWDEAARALLASAERRAALVARGAAVSGVAVRGWSDVAVLAAARGEVVGAADALARARAAADGDAHADPAVEAALAEVAAWLATLAIPGRGDAAPWELGHAAEPSAALPAPDSTPAGALLDLAADAGDARAHSAADWMPALGGDEFDGDPTDVVTLTLIEDDADPFAAFGLGCSSAAAVRGADGFDIDRFGVDAGGTALLADEIDADEIELTSAGAGDAFGTVLELPSVSEPWPDPTLTAVLVADVVETDADVAEVVVPDAFVPDAFVADAFVLDGHAPDAAAERSTDLTFLELEGPLRPWELPAADAPLVDEPPAFASPVPAARTPLAPPLAPALRTGAGAATARNAAVDAVVALTEAKPAPSGFRSLLRRIARR